jgi:FkbM family methyltransferase
VNFNRPEYLFQPKFLKKRVCSALGFQGSHTSLYQASFGFAYHCLPDDGITRAIATYGVYDLAIGELLFRLLEPGDTFIDIGANIGYYSVLGALAVGSRGRVLAFEPNPVSGAMLRENTNRLHENQGYPIIVTHAVALSDSDGSAVLTQSADSGLVMLDNSLETGIKVQTRRLDSFATGFSKIRMVKLDVEGHERECLLGASALLESKTIEHLVYEHHSGYPGTVSELLEAYGYKIFGIHRGWLHPRLKNPSTAHASVFEPPNYLATLHPDLALAQMKKAGWKTLKRLV